MKKQGIIKKKFPIKNFILLFLILQPPEELSERKKITLDFIKFEDK